MAIYESSQPDTLTVILNSDGFDELLSRYEYLQRIQSQDNAIAERVRTLRDETRDMVERVRAARDEIAAQRAELARTRIELESRQADLAAAREQTKRRSPGCSTPSTSWRATSATSRARSRLSYRHRRTGRRAGTAGGAHPGRELGGIHLARERARGLRLWDALGPHAHGHRHRGAGRTPIRAAAAGTVAIAGPNAGYGNYTCIDHGGGRLDLLCAPVVDRGSVGQCVGQGQVIGAVGCTGHCFGDHLHFEVRVNGSPVDPMGYL